MRIIIDLQACQSGAARAPEAALALAQQLVRGAGTHTVLVVLHARFRDSLAALRQAFAGLLPAEQLYIFTAPAGTGTWIHDAAEHVRDAFLSDLAGDLVFVPGLFEQAGAPALFGAAGPLTAYSVADAGLLRRDGAAALASSHLRSLRALRQSSLLAGVGEDTCAQLRAAFPQAVVCDIGSGETSGQKAAAVLWDGFAALLTARRAHDAAVGAATAAVASKPTMAYVSPLPPQQSGIADYSVELLAQLTRFYDIELVVDHAGPYDDKLSAAHRIRSVEWFETHADHYQRVLYHFGNSGVHQHMFELLRRQPGVVVLHDFFLSGVLDNMERDGYLPQAFLGALYESHGYSGLLAHQRDGRNASIWAFPCNKGVLDHATGVIVHSEFSRQLARQWYGADSADAWSCLPLIRGLPAGYEHGAARAAARQALGLQADDFLICSFGMMGVTKLNARLLDAFLSSPLAADPRCRLVFVGAGDAGQYGRELARKIAASPAAGRVAITGFVTPEDYARYLSAADSAVQLRSQSRGETSASVLDCLLYGLPTVINAHGSSAALPDALLVKLDDDCDSAQLADALLRLRDEPDWRAVLGRQARDYMAREHAPEQVGAQFHAAIEDYARHSPHAHYARLLAALARLPGAADADLMATAEAIAANRPPAAPRQLFVDISALVQTDLKTGIQRVVRSILLGLIEAPPAGYRIEPVFSDGGNRPYRYARSFTAALVGVPELVLEDAPLEVRRGDLFLGLDLFTNGTAQNRARLLDMRNHGVQVYFVVYDLLPVLMPDAFPFGAEGYFADYLDTIAAVSDGLVCISRAVADELRQWLAQRPQRPRPELRLGYFHLGADIDASAPSFGLPDNAAQVLDSVQQRPTFLMVGTVEPRKGQAQALAAFDLLWQQGVEANLVIVGKQGWMVDALARQLQQHPESERRLFWLPGASDEMLLKLYQSSAALVAASIGEGFGLPLIEAAQHGLPIIARDLPVFREVGGAHAHYFSGQSPQELASALQAWLALDRAGNAPQSAAMPWLSWSDSAQQLLRTVHGQQWYRSADGASPVQKVESA